MAHQALLEHMKNMIYHLITHIYSVFFIFSCPCNKVSIYENKLNKESLCDVVLLVTYLFYYFFNFESS